MSKYTSAIVVVVFACAFLAGCAASRSSTADVLDRSIHSGDWSKTQVLCNQLLKSNPDDADALTARAALNYAVGKTADALSDCDKVIAKNPNCAPALNLRGTILCRIDRPLAGRKDLKAYVAMTTADLDLHTHSIRGTAFWNLGDEESANKEFHSVLENFPPRSSDSRSSGFGKADEDLFDLGSARASLGKIKEAKETFAKLARKYPRAPFVAVSLAYCYAMSGEPDLAIKKCAEIAKQRPDLMANHSAWGLALENQKKYPEAIEQFNMELYRESSLMYPLMQRARCFRANKDYTRALEDFNELLAMDPDDMHALLERAYLYSKMGRKTEAIQDCNRVVAVKPKNAEAWSQLAHMKADLQNWNEALLAVNKSIELKSNNANDLCTRAWIETSLREFKQAYADYDKAIRIDPKRPGIYFDRGLLYRDQKQYSKSIADLSKAIALDATVPEYFCARGCAEVRNHAYKEAIDDCNKSIKLDSLRTHPYQSRGEAYAALGQYESAVRDFTFVIDKYPECTEAIAQRALVYRNLGKPKLAALDQARLNKLKLSEHHS